MLVEERYTTCGTGVSSLRVIGEVRHYPEHPPTTTSSYHKHHHSSSQAISQELSSLIQRYRLGLHGVHDDIFVVPQLEGGSNALLDANGVCGEEDLQMEGSVNSTNEYLIPTKRHQSSITLLEVDVLEGGGNLEEKARQIIFRVYQQFLSTPTPVVLLVTLQLQLVHGGSCGVTWSANSCQCGVRQIVWCSEARLHLFSFHHCLDHHCLPPVLSCSDPRQHSQGLLEQCWKQIVTYSK
ncbi:hypothetical protein E2C01_014453 [Portunus trituberculatus]|uniref:Uncharacterized protein n=1 Tax=Portunus trituberculatus TaxID=210409 RepID=A0A5B7DK30_PORTR|nr:hypothetical protein [Portunus trituberculatus]